MEVTETMDDEKIIELYFCRDEEAIRRTEERYGRRLRALSGGIVGNREDAEECVSDTFLRAWNSIPPARPNGLFHYLARICRNLSLDRVDWNRAAKRKAEIVTLTAEMEQCIPAAYGAVEMGERELGEKISAFLATLSPENQMVFVRRYWFAEPVAQIAARYGIKEGALHTRLHRIRKKLAAYLEKEGISV